MRSAQSEKVRCDAANSLLTHLAKPKELAPMIAIDVKESSGVTELREALLKLAKGQQDAVANGVSVRDIASSKIVDVEARDAD